MTLDLGPDDYLIYPRAVHIMRYMGYNENGNPHWRIACGAQLSEEFWANLGLYTPSLEEIEEHNFAVCGNCNRTKATK